VIIIIFITNYFVIKIKNWYVKIIHNKKIIYKFKFKFNGISLTWLIYNDSPFLIIDFSSKFSRLYRCFRIRLLYFPYLFYVCLALFRNTRETFKIFLAFKGQYQCFKVYLHIAWMSFRFIFDEFLLLCYRIRSLCNNANKMHKHYRYWREFKQFQVVSIHSSVHRYSVVYDSKKWREWINSFDNIIEQLFWTN
jgi:hypothetical protein